MNNTINNNTFLGRSMVNYNAICNMVSKYNRLYLFNPALSENKKFIYIDCTYGNAPRECTIKILHFPEKEDGKFISYGDYDFKLMIKEKYAVYTCEADARNVIKSLSAISLNPPVVFSNGNTIKQNYLRLYPTIPVRYQILITSRNKRKGETSDDGYDICYHGEVRVEHYTNWMLKFQIDYDSYAKAFRACEQFIESHMRDNPVYDNE